MKRFFALFLIGIFLVSCSKSHSGKRSPDILMADIREKFTLEDGYYYSTKKTEETLTDAILDRLFMGARLDDLRYAEEISVYLSKRFSEEEIIIVRLFDRSHANAVMSLLQTRAEKKENAVVFQNGVYLYLICTDQNDAIVSYLKE